MRKAFKILIIAVLLTGMGMRIQSLSHKVSTRTLETSPGQILTEDARLFNTLLETGMITPSDDGRLELPLSDLILVEKAEQAQNPDSVPSDPKELKTKERLISSLYHSLTGDVVQTQVKLWNDTRYLTAIRDNRPESEGSRESKWHAYDAGSSRWDFLRTGKRVPESFGFVNNGRLQPNFGDWLAAYTVARKVEFRTTLTLQTSRSVSVQVIGKPETIHPRPSRIEPCYRKKEKNCSAGNAEASAIHFSLPAGTHTLSITASPARNTETKVGGLNICMKSDRSSFQWVNLRPGSPASYKHFKLMTSDNIALTDDRGNPTPACEKLGLVPLTGVGSRTPYSLYGILSRSVLPPDMAEVFLTLDSRKQTLARESLTRRIDTLWPNDKYSDRRRGALIILDADTGAILAAATHPVPPSGVHPWDLSSFGKVYPLKNPMLMRGWQGADRHNAPGSTFKPVVALAAMGASEDNRAIPDFLEGFTMRKFNRGTGLNLNCTAYHPVTGDCYTTSRLPRKIPNFRNEALSLVFEKNKLEKNRKSVFGLREAVRDSVNIWFARLAVITDGELATAYDKTMKDRMRGSPIPDFPDFQLVKTAQKLGFGDPLALDMGINTPPNIQLHRRTPVKGGREGDVLYGYTGKTDLMERTRGIQMWILAQNAIGQGMTTTPLQMSRVAGTIATGEIISPYLIRQWGGTRAKPSKKKDLGIDENQLNLLRTGMKAVPEAGTAKGAFWKYPDLRKSVYGKTGTADVAEKNERSFNTTWFIGWYEPQNKEKQEKLAFACMITHAYGQRRTGGSVCAPIIAEILAADQTEATENSGG
ncbi:penicillin-binding transpeptidase domain-containing protein [Desulfococcaceae bacterium HSG8]|nr:penicillin-binding transpeptidase domain-containing protein [Desulfococcaceae bacterium HSG8]